MTTFDDRFSFFPIATSGRDVAQLALPNESSDPVVNAYKQGLALNRYLIDLLNVLTQPGDFVLDLGCHVGTLAVPAAALGRTVAAVDASKLHTEAVGASRVRNQLDNLSIVWCAVAEADGEAVFHENGLWGTVHHGDSPAAGERVPAKRVDSLIDQLQWPRLDFVKMDVEGSELHALKSMNTFLSRPDSPSIVYESNGMTFDSFGYSIEQVRAFLEERGYRTYRFEGDRFVYCPPDQLQPEAWLNVIALPERRRHELRARIDDAWPDASMISRCLEWGASEHANVRQYLHSAMSSTAVYPRSDARLASLLRKLDAEWTTAASSPAVGADRADATGEAQNAAQPSELPVPEFNAFLHALRTEALRDMPAGARVLLSAGCSGRWYFDWIAENYPGVERHIGIEAYSPKPDDLPGGVEWIANSVAEMSAVPTATVDLLFSGQNIEHLAPDHVVGFLCEAKRVLRPGGSLVMDSPNRAITERLGWIQPEHVLEFRVDEMRELVELAGFDVESIRGLWSCYDPHDHRLLPLDPGTDRAGNQRRITAGRNDPENSFVWWVTARNADRVARRDALLATIERIQSDVFSRMILRFRTQVGRIVHRQLAAEAFVDKGNEGFVVYGPYIVLFPGRYTAWFRLRAPADSAAGMFRRSSPVARLDVVSFHRGQQMGERSVSLAELRETEADGATLLSIPFVLTDTGFGVEFRVYSTGASAFSVSLPVNLTHGS